MGKNLPEDYKSVSNKMPEVKTSSNNEQEDKIYIKENM